MLMYIVGYKVMVRKAVLIPTLSALAANVIVAEALLFSPTASYGEFPGYVSSPY
jgi:hypothetical protein